jgi:uncharacterized OB-fold protein
VNGWECPKCGAVMSPFHPTCWYCKPINKINLNSAISQSNGDIAKELYERLKGAE